MVGHVSSEVLSERELRRQRSNNISDLMGQYLLKGWRMLGSNCSACDTILFMNPDGNTYCVACSEVDNEIKLNNVPATTETSLPNNACGDAPSGSLKSEYADNSKESFEIIYKKTREKLDFMIEKSLIAICSADPSVLKGPKALLNRCLHCQTNLILSEEGLPYCVYCGHADKLHLKESRTMWDTLSTQAKINAIKTRYELIESIASETVDLPGKRLNQRPDMISEYLFKGWRLIEKCCTICNAVMFSNPEGGEACIFCTEVGKKENQASPKSPKATSTEGPSEWLRQCQRSDKISQVMGQYLLRGWRMLDKCCSTCDTILMLNREGKLYCIGCSEVDNQKKQEPEPTPIQNQPINDNTTDLTQRLPIVDLFKLPSPMQYATSLKDIQTGMVNAIHACSQRIAFSPSSMDAERNANAAKSLSEALLNLQKFSST